METERFTTEKLKVDINKIKPNEWNPNAQEELMFEKEVHSIEEFGFVQPILVREKGEDYEIIDGEHRWRACKELAYKEIYIENMGEVPDDQAKALTLVMNNVKGEDDPVKRGLIFADLQATNPALLEVLPFDEVDILHDIELASYPEYNEEYDEEKQQMYVIYKFEIDKDDAEMVEKALRSLDANNDVAFMQLIYNYVNKGQEG